MGDSRKAIAEDTDEYCELCRRYGEAPECDAHGPNPYSAHAKQLFARHAAEVAAERAKQRKLIDEFLQRAGFRPFDGEQLASSVRRLAEHAVNELEAARIKLELERTRVAEYARLNEELIAKCDATDARANWLAQELSQSPQHGYKSALAAAEGAALVAARSDIYTPTEPQPEGEVPTPAISYGPVLTAAATNRAMWTALGDVAVERTRQDGKWGGTAHDDGHTVADFAQLIEDYAGWARTMAGMASMAKARRRLIQVAALAVAAVESIDRKEAKS